MGWNKTSTVADPLTRTETTYWRDENYNGGAQVRQDVTAILERAKYHRATTDERAKWESDTHNHIAFLPNVVIVEHLARGVNLYKDKAALRKWLKSDDSAPFRTRHFKL